jgi:hypothetical protein
MSTPTDEIRRFLEHPNSVARVLFVRVFNNYSYSIEYDDDDEVLDIYDDDGDLVWNKHEHFRDTLWRLIPNDMQYDILVALGVKTSRLSVGKNVKLPLPDAKLLHF